MATCSSCGATIVFGGSRQGGLRFCNDRCMKKYSPLTVLHQVPEDLVQKYAASVHTGRCPKCQGEDPVDVHTSHRVWSALYVTTWNSRRAFHASMHTWRKTSGRETPERRNTSWPSRRKISSPLCSQAWPGRISTSMESKSS